MANYKNSLILVKEYLDNGETIHYSVYGTYETKLRGGDTIRKGIFIATEKRIVFFAKKLFGYALESFAFKNILSIEKSKGFMGNSISISASGNTSKMKWINEGDISKFTEYLNSKIGRSASNNIQANRIENDIPSQIQKTTDLKDKGILSEDEFNSKKIEFFAKM
jgi:hypothetical protein